MPRPTAGVTVVELIITICVVAIVGSIAVPALRNIVDSVKLMTATNTIKRKLIAARIRAIANPYEHCGVHFDVANGKTLVFFDNGTVNNSYDSGTDRVYQVASQLPGGVTLVAAADPITNDAVVFRGDGSAYRGGGIQIRSPRGRTKTVSVLASTGRVSVQ